jgi:16S rRNA C1402 (ribose-2'-O) methylase RsmI
MGSVIFGCTDIGNSNDLSRTFFNELNSSDALVVENQYMWDSFCLDNNISYTKEVLSLNLPGLKDKFLNELPEDIQRLFKDNRSMVFERLHQLYKSGKTVLVLSDEGSSIIADSGEFVRNYCIENGIDFRVMSGPSAVINSISSSKISGSLSPFIFYGPMFSLDYLDNFLENIKRSPNYFLSVAFLDTKTANNVVKRMLEEFGNVDACICINLTTDTEKVIGKNLKDIVEYFQQMGDEYKIKKEKISIVFRNTGRE